MKVTIRFATVLAICAIIVAFAPKPVQAQSGLDLSAATKQITDSITNFKATSFAIDWSLTVKATGTKSGDGNASFSGTGAFAYDPAKIDKSNPTSISTPGAITFQNSLTYSETMGATPLKGKAEIRVVNGNLYLDSNGTGQFLQVSLADGIAYLKSYASSMSGGMGGTGAGGATPAPGAVMAGMMADPDIMASWTKILGTPGFIAATNGADQTIDGASVSNLTITVDLTKLLDSPDLPTLVQALSKYAATMNPSAAAGSAQAMSSIAMAKSAVKKGTITLTWLISKDDQSFRGFGVNIDANVVSPSNPSPVTISMAFQVQLSKIGQPVTVTAPANAIPYPIGGGMPGGGGGMPGGGAGMMPTPPATPAQ